MSSATPTCLNCGAAFMKPTAKFCSRCGTKKTAALPLTSGASSPLGSSSARTTGSSGSGHPPPKATTGVSKPGGATTTTVSSTPATPATAVGAGAPDSVSTLRPSDFNGATKQPVLATSIASASRAKPPPTTTTTTTTKRVSVTPPTATRSKTGSTSGAAGSSSSSNPLRQRNVSVVSDPGADRELMEAEDTARGYKTIELDESLTVQEKYSSWATLGPNGLTPQMLMTEGAEKQLAGWRKCNLIGRGTYGSVYLGLLNDGSFHAVKCVELGKEATESIRPDHLVSLSREITMMQRLTHRNLCRFKGVWYDEEERHICMFMQCIGGGSLTSFVKKFKPLPPKVIRIWTKQLLSGLLYLHAQHIIHRDVKGENVLVDTSAEPGSSSQIKLVDFGAARRLTDAVSQSRTVIGTPYWMAPEVVDFSGEGEGYSYKADVWSVGCTVAEMLTGSPPWPQRSNAAATIMMIANSTDGPTEIPEKEATPGCLDFMKQCFIRDADQRPTIEELLQHPWILGDKE